MDNDELWLTYFHVFGITQCCTCQIKPVINDEVNHVDQWGNMINTNIIGGALFQPWGNIKIYKWRANKNHETNTMVIESHNRYVCCGKFHAFSNNNNNYDSWRALCSSVLVVTCWHLLYNLSKLNNQFSVNNFVSQISHIHRRSAFDGRVNDCWPRIPDGFFLLIYSTRQYCS